MQRLLQTVWVIVAGAITALPMEAQGALRLGIVAPAPLTRPLVLTVPAEPLMGTRGIRWHSYAGSGTPIYPSLWVVNGKPLGLRSDGYVDRVVAQRELRRIRCSDVVSIDVLSGNAPATRAGSNVPDGIVLLVTRPPAAGDDASLEP